MKKKISLLVIAFLVVACAFSFSACVGLNSCVHSNICVVTFDSNGGSGVMSPVYHTVGTPKALKSNKFTRPGYIFTGWNTMDDGNGTAYADEESITVKRSDGLSNITLYAQWEVSDISYIIVYEANGGIGTMTPSEHIIDVSKKLSANGFTRSDYIFAVGTRNLTEAEQPMPAAQE